MTDTTGSADSADHSQSLITDTQQSTSHITTDATPEDTATDTTADTTADTTTDTTADSTADSTPQTSPAGDDTTDAITQAPTPSPIEGKWLAGKPSSAGTREVWCFESGGKFYLYQLDSADKVIKTVSGSYRESASTLSVTMNGNALSYTYQLSADRLVLTDHGDEEIFTAYSGEIKR